MAGVRVATGGKAQWSTDGVTYVDIPEVRKWTLNIGGDKKQYASSSTGGGKRNIAGAEDFNGSISLYHDAATRLDAIDLTALTTGYLKLWEDATDFWVAPSFIDSVSVNEDIEGGNIIDGDVAFSRDGSLVYPS
jgi:hypothetical protein